MRKEKLRKVGLCFITVYLIKLVKMRVNHFFFNRSFCTQQFCLFLLYIYIYIYESFIIAKNLYFFTRMNLGRKKIVTVVLT